MDGLETYISTHGKFNRAKSVATISIFDIPTHLFQTIIPEKSIETIVSHKNIEVSSNSRGFGCRACNSQFEDWEQQKNHFQSNEHLSKITNKAILMNNEEGLTNSNENDKSDSSSDTDSFDDDHQPQNTEIITIDGKIQTNSYSSYTGSQIIFQPHEKLFQLSLSSVLFSNKDDLWTKFNENLIKFSNDNIWSVFIFKSGKFAGTVFQGNKIIIHKVFRRYTIRAKSGGSQSSHDNQKGKANSMGAQLRRHGETALKEDIHNLLIAWKEYINISSLILISAPKARRNTFFDETNELPFKRDDIRIRYVPFSVDNPTYESTITVHRICSTMTYFIQSIDSTIIETIELIPGISIVNPQIKEKPVEILKLKDCVPSKELIKYCYSGETEKVIELLKSVSEGQFIDEITGNVWNIFEVISMPETIDNWSTPLHIASTNGQSNIVYQLLHSGADPCIRDTNNRTAYFLAKDKDTRDMYRKYRGLYESNDELYGWDWDSAGIGLAITNQTEKLKKDKEKEKKKRLKEKKKDEKEKSAEQINQINETNEKQRIIDENENKILHEFQLLNAGHCFMCNKSLFQITPYELLDHKCCSSDCVAKLRRKLNAEAAMKRFNIKT